jgi:hypothetical protein
MPVIIALGTLHKIPVKPWTGPILTQGTLPLLKSRLLVQVTQPQPLYRCLMESRLSDGLTGHGGTLGFLNWLVFRSIPESEYCLTGISHHFLATASFNTSCTILKNLSAMRSPPPHSNTFP